MERNRNLLVFGGLVLVAAAALSACGVGDAIGETSQRTQNDVIDAAGVDALVVVTEGGWVEVTTDDVDEITVETTFDEPDRGAGDADIEVDGGRLLVSGECDKSWYERCSVGFHITLPPGVDVTLSTDNGRIELAGTTGDVDVFTSNGRIEASALGSTSVRARTDNGRVELGFVSAPSHVEARSDNGRVVVTLPADGPAYAVDADSDNGGVDVDVATDPASPRTVVASSDNGAVTVTSA